MNRALVVGGGGFIGTNLTSTLINRGWRCTVIDDGSGLGGIRPLQIDAKVVRVSVSDLKRTDIPSADVTYYLAARVAGLSYNASHQAEMLHSNLAALHGLPCCYASRPGVLVYFSTACVYPSNAPIPTDESWGHRGEPEATNLGYGIAKRVGERLAGFLCDEYAVPTTIVRPFNTYGPWDHFGSLRGHFIPAILMRMVRQEPEITVWGGDQKRAFVYVDDLVDVAVALAACKERYAVVNVGHAEQITIRDAVSVMRDLSHYRGRIRFEEGIVGYQRRAADNSELHRLLGDVSWTPFESGVKKLLAWLGNVGADHVACDDRVYS